MHVFTLCSFSFWTEACSAALARHCQAEGWSGGGQLCSSRGSAQQWQAAWRVLSLHFTAPCLALTHCAIQSPDRIFTLLWAPHHCESEFICKASRIFLVRASQRYLHLFQSRRFYRSIETGGYRTCQREFSSSSPSSSSCRLCLRHPVSESILQNFPSVLPTLIHSTAIHSVYLLSACFLLRRRITVWSCFDFSHELKVKKILAQ